MSRLIDADSLQRRIEGELSLIEETLKTSKNEQERSHLLIMIAGRNGFIKEIKKADTVDAVEVVRCKECKHWDDDDCPCEGMYIVTADCFCFWGEKK